MHATQRRPRPRPTRSDGWTPARQIAFLETLARTRSITVAAAAVGMSREGAYRLRGRPGGALFAALWDLALAPDIAEGHGAPLTCGRILRLLGTDLRRKRGDFAALAALGRRKSAAALRTPTS